MNESIIESTHGRFQRARAFVVVVAMCFWCVAAIAHANEPIVATDLYRIRTVSAIEVASDATRAIFVVNSIGTQTGKDGDTEHINQSHLWTVSLTGNNANPQQLTFGTRRDSQPKISPDGRLVAFVRRGIKDFGEGADEAQVWILPLAGGEARQVTHLKHGASQPQWLPNGKQLLVSSDIPIDEMEGEPSWPMERPNRTFRDDKLPDGVEAKADGTRAQIRAWLAQNERNADPRLVSRIEFQGEHTLRDDYSFAQLFVVSVDDDDAAPRQITKAYADHSQAMVLPDGRAVVYSTRKPTSTHPDRVRANELWTVNLDGTNDRKLFSIDGWSLRSPKPSRDGAVIAFTAERTDQQSYRLAKLGIIPLTMADPDAPREPTWLTDSETQDGPILNFEWNTARGASILFTTASKGAFPLMMISFGLLEPALLVNDFEGTQAGVFAFGVGGGATVYSLSTFANPCTLMMRDVNGERELFDLNDWTGDKIISRPRESWITRPDGTRVQYWVMEPTQREAKKKYPLVLEMHGGPMWMWGPGEPSMWLEFQLLTSFGYGVVYANPRGSAGYGEKFQMGNVPDWGEGPAGDVLGAVDKAVLEEWVDKDRLCITGGSYAGYLTAWIVGHDHRFKAAVAQRGVYDFATFFGEGNAWQLVEDTFGALPFDPRVRDVIARNNPFSSAGKIRTPLLIIHADQDLRTGVSQSEMLYRALKAQGKPVEYARYPDAGHDLSRTGDPDQRVDRVLRIIEFFDRHISNTRPAPEVGGGTVVSQEPAATKN